MASISEDQNRAAAQAIMLLLLTGARRREITQAKWEHVDWDEARVAGTGLEVGQPRTIALNAAALALLKSIPRDPPALISSRRALSASSTRGTASVAVQVFLTSACMTCATRSRAFW